MSWSNYLINKEVWKYTQLLTAYKTNGLNPTKYIEYILKDIPGSAFMEYPEFLEEYTPWDPLVQKFCK